MENEMSKEDVMKYSQLATVQKKQNIVFGKWKRT